VFVVFRQGPAKVDPVVALSHDGRPILPPIVRKAQLVVQKARYGIFDDPQRTRDVRAKLQALLDLGESRVRVAEMARGDDPAPMVVKTLEVDYTADGQPQRASGQDPDTIRFAAHVPPSAECGRVRTDAAGRIVLEASQGGRFELRTAGGRTLRADMPSVPSPLEIAGPWRVTFPAQPVVQQAPGALPAPRQIQHDKLISWSERPEADIKYYSGTAGYRTTFNVPAGLIAADRRLELDLGRVAVMAQVRLNGRELGILWKPPYTVDVTALVKPGVNTLEAQVVNLWINRLIGDEQLPDDSPRQADGSTLKEWPQWLLDGKPSPTGRHTFTSHRLWKRDDPLVESGLLGPVTLRTRLAKIVAEP
jgi:hypothetical protein